MSEIACGTSVARLHHVQTSSKVVLSIAASLFFSIGCSHTRDLKTVAASDFRCPSDQVVVHKGSKKNGREVTGCGLSGRYRFQDGEWLREDGWAMVTTTPPAQPAPVAASPSAIAPESAPATAASPIVVNGTAWDDRTKQQAARYFGQPPASGQWWYDAKSGLFGAVGHGTQGVLKPGFRAAPLARNVSNGDTAVFVNGREITRAERDYLVTIFDGDVRSPQQYAGSYELDHNGNLRRGGAYVGNVVQAARAKQARASGGGNTWHTKNGAMGGSAPGCSWVYIPNSTTNTSTSVMSGCD